MNILFIISIFACLFTYLGSRHKIRFVLEIGFIILFCFSAFRFAYGNDYLNYAALFETINSDQFTFKGLINKEIYKEPGWALLNILCEPLTFFGLQIIVSLLTVGSVYFVIKKDVSEKWQPLAVLIYVFNFSFYALSLSMMRQSLAMSIFLIAVHFMMKSNKITSLLITYVASLFHTSALILIPFMFIQYINVKNVKGWIVLCVIASFVLFMGADIVNSVFGAVLDNDSFSMYNSQNNLSGSSTIGLGAILMFFIPFIVFASALSEQNLSNNKYVLLLAMITTVLIPLSMHASLFMRVTFYFNILYLLAIPIALDNTSKSQHRKILIGLYLIGMLLTYFMTINNVTYSKSYSEYMTIFEAGLKML